MVTLKEYAKAKNVSYEAVRKQVKRYSVELEKHIFKTGRTQFLDDIAVEFLDQKRNDNPVVVIHADREEELQQLRDENKNLLIKIAQLQDDLLNEKEQVKALQMEKIELLEEKQEKKRGWKFLKFH